MDSQRILQMMFQCHRLPERSFFYRGKQFPICSRCTGILVGYFIGIFLLFMGIRVHFVGIFLMMIPIAIDGVGQYYGKWMSTNPRRFVTGTLGGISAMFIFHFVGSLGWAHGQWVVRMLLDK